MVIYILFVLYRIDQTHFPCALRFAVIVVSGRGCMLKCSPPGFRSPPILSWLNLLSLFEDSSDVFRSAHLDIDRHWPRWKRLEHVVVWFWFVKSNFHVKILYIVNVLNFLNYFESLHGIPCYILKAYMAMHTMYFTKK